MSESVRREKVCIVGYAPGREKAPFTDESFDFWGMNDLWAHWSQFPHVAPRWDAWFDLHNQEVQRNNFRTGSAHYDWLKGQKHLPIYLLHEDEEIPHGIPFPLEDIAEHFGCRYFTSTPAYQIAFAAYLGYKEIHVYGVNLLGAEEYEYQRPCAEYWIGVARGMGIHVYLPDESTLCKASYLYGYDTHGSQEAIKLARTVRKYVADHEAKRSGAIQQVHRLEGALEALKWAGDMMDHVNRGQHIPDVEGAPIPPAGVRQDMDRKIQGMVQVRKLVERAKRGDQAALDELEPHMHSMLSLPDRS